MSVEWLINPLFLLLASDVSYNNIDECFFCEIMRLVFHEELSFCFVTRG